MNRTRFVYSTVFAACGLLLSTGACDRDDAKGEDDRLMVATARLTAADGSRLSGEITFTQRDDVVAIEGDLGHLPSGTHGFHIHEESRCDGPTFESAGGHFAPSGNRHGAPSDSAHHAGDLGNIQANDEGRAAIQRESQAITLAANDARSVVGRAVIIHARADDMKSQPSGDAGDRIACGIIQLGQTDDNAAR